MNCHSTCKASSLNIEKYEVNISQENFNAFTGFIDQSVVTVISKESKLIISQNLAFSILYFTFNTGEKLVSTSKTSTSSSLSNNSS
jgi:hypothetical protein